MNLSDIIVSDPRQTITVPAGGAISSGDLVTLLESGQAAKTSTTLGIPNENVTTAGPSAIRAVAEVESTGYGSDVDQHHRMCELGNGNIAIAYTGNGYDINASVNLRIRTVLGADVIPRAILSTDRAVYCCRVLKISSTQFVVAWAVNGGSLKFMVLNNDGTTAVYAVTVATLNAATDTSYWNIGLLSNGQFVFAYTKETSNNVCFSRYNASGALQGSETTIESEAQGQYFAVLGCSNGDFVVSYHRGAATTAHKAARYSSSGVQVGSLLTLSSYVIQSIGDYSNGIVELSNGNVAIAKSGDSSGYPDIQLFNSSHVSQTTIDLGTNIVGREMPQLVANSGGFAVFYRNLSPYTTAIRTFDNAGQGMLSQVTFGTVDGNATTATGGGVQAFALGQHGYAVIKVAGHSESYSAVRLNVINSIGVVAGSEVVLLTWSWTPVYGFSAVLSSAGTLALTYKEGTVLKDAYYHVQRRSVLGVANNTVSAGQNAEIKTKGTYAINQAFGMGGSFNNQATVVPGSKGIVSGSTAILMGVSA